jgi:hypothetical protein
MRDPPLGRVVESATHDAAAGAGLSARSWSVAILPGVLRAELQPLRIRDGSHRLTGEAEDRAQGF